MKMTGTIKPRKLCSVLHQCNSRLRNKRKDVV